MTVYTLFVVAFGLMLACAAFAIGGWVNLMMLPSKLRDEHRRPWGVISVLLGWALVVVIVALLTLHAVLHRRGGGPW